MGDFQLVITMEGGLIREVFANSERIQVQIVDFDVEGADPSEITATPLGDEAVQRREFAKKNIKLVEEFFKQKL